MRTAILVFDDVEVLDACGPFEVLGVAAREVTRAEAGLGTDDPGPRETVLVSASDRGTALARGGLLLTAHHTLDDAPDVDLLIVPGGVTDAVEKDLRVLAWVAARAAAPTLVASVCTGAFVLAEAGVLTGGRATTHWEDVGELARRYPALDVVDSGGPREGWEVDAGGGGGSAEPVRWVRNGPRLWTSAGISAGLDLALALVAETGGLPLARATARRMDYAWESRAHRAEVG